jgi:FtsZ-interacting cell division protein ZipA
MDMKRIRIILGFLAITSLLFGGNAWARQRQVQIIGHLGSDSE